MNTQQTLDSEYTVLCSELGDIAFKITLLQAQQSAVLSKLQDFVARSRVILEQERKNQAMVDQAGLKAAPSEPTEKED